MALVLGDRPRSLLAWSGLGDECKVRIVRSCTGGVFLALITPRGGRVYSPGRYFDIMRYSFVKVLLFSSVSLSMIRLRLNDFFAVVAIAFESLAWRLLGLNSVFVDIYVL